MEARFHMDELDDGWLFNLIVPHHTTLSEDVLAVEQAFEWCTSNTSGSWERMSSLSLCINDSMDAMTFRLRWC